MHQHHRLVKIIIVGVVVIGIVSAVAYMLKSKEAPIEIENQQGGTLNSLEQDESVPVSTKNSTTTSSGQTLNKITTSSNLESDFDAYINSTGDLPDSNQYNDSYSDLN